MVSQVQALCRILDKKDLSLITNNNLTEEFFSETKAEYNFIKQHYEMYKTVPDKVTFLSVFPDFSYTEVREPDNFIVEQLIQDYKANYMATMWNEGKRKLESGKYTETEQLLKEGVEKLSKITTGIQCTDLIKDTSRYDRYLEKSVQKNKYYISTGFPELDQKLSRTDKNSTGVSEGGIDMLEENMVIIARTGVGKTQVLLKMAAEAWLEGKRVGIYEGEMTADKVGYRIDTFISHIQNSSINRGDLFVQQRYKAYIDSLKATEHAPIKVLTPNDVPGGEVTVDTLKAFIEKENLEILFVDQYDLLEEHAYVKAEHERVGLIAKRIKQLQVEKQIPIISVCQMNRTKNEDGEQDTTQVAGSDKISRYATTIIALEQKNPDFENHTIELTLNIIKARDGGDHNKLKYTTDFNTGRFNYIPVSGDGVTSSEDQQNLADSYAPASSGTITNPDSVFN